MEQRKGDWLQTFTGIQFWPLDPRPEEIVVEDIAHALSNQCRYSGHVRKFYSVAEHSVRVALHVKPPHRLWGLLHDAPETYLVDLAGPIKHYSRLGDAYREIEEPLMKCVCARFGLSPAEPVEVKVADNELLMTEKRDLMGPGPAKWREENFQPLREIIVPWSPEMAERKFLELFAALTY
jgi:hypothetical protein